MPWKLLCIWFCCFWGEPQYLWVAASSGSTPARPPPATSHCPCKWHQQATQKYPPWPWGLQCPPPSPHPPRTAWAGERKGTVSRRQEGRAEAASFPGWDSHSIANKGNDTSCSRLPPCGTTFFTNSNLSKDEVFQISQKTKQKNTPSLLIVYTQQRKKDYFSIRTKFLTQN